MDTAQRIADFLAEGPWAVAGASTNREKYGNKALRAYQQRGRTVYPVNPRAQAIEGLKSYPDLASLPPGVRGLSIVTPPAITERLVEEAAAAGIRRVWMQPGAESVAAVRRAEELGLAVISGGPCVLVSLGFRG